MKYRNSSASTQRIYASAVLCLATFLETQDPSPDPAEVSRRHIESFVRFRLDQVKPATVSADFRALQQFFKWLMREDEIAKNPMDGAEAPIVPEAPTPVLEVEQLRALIAGRKGKRSCFPPGQRDHSTADRHWWPPRRDR